MVLWAWCLPGCSQRSLTPKPAPKAGAEAAPSQPRAFRPFFFVLAGDPHIGITEGAARRFSELARQVSRLKPAFVLVPGDVIHGLKEKNMAAFDSAVKEFQVPVKFVPGNHDVRDHDSLETYRKRYGRDYYAFTHNNCDFLCLNAMTLSSKNWHFRGKDAQFDKEHQAQWAWLERALAEAEGARREHVFILTHVPPFTKRQDERRKYTNMAPESRRRLLALARKYGVRAILAGHVHRTRQIEDGGVTIYTVSGTFLPIDGQDHGYRVFKVEKGRISQRYVRLEDPPEKLEF